MKQVQILPGVPSETSFVTKTPEAEEFECLSLS